MTGEATNGDLLQAVGRVEGACTAMSNRLAAVELAHRDVVKEVRGAVVPLAKRVDGLEKSRSRL